MEKYSYLIIGGGMAADAAARGIREKDSTGRIGIITDESYPCYDRPPLSKGLWTGSPYESIWANTEQENVTFHLERRVVEINPKTHTVTDHVGNVYWYKKLLLTTGCSRRQLDCPNEGVQTLHTLQDYHRIRDQYESCNEYVVIGSGYIGTEIAAALRMNGKNVTLIFRQPALMFQKLPKGFSAFLNSYYTEKGVHLIPNTTVTSVKKEQTQLRVTTSDGKQILADSVIAGLGTTPNTELAESIGLKCDNGITVNRHLQTSDPDIYAAGDVANFYAPLLEKRIRCEHEDTAKTMGRIVGQNMTGCKEEYTHLPYFYSDLFELGYTAIGMLGNQFEIFEDWHDLYRKGVLYYLENECVVGGMMWGIWDQQDAMRQLIASKKRFNPIT